ncbi:MAG: hypothetical protein SLAVMIC_00536 [uncultured marine phage]|uniref:Uncharacterized protein n=1 Tax=uncultured marine phage TaxID=707152 RepID=A0A8D9CED1_9VIRU|nr:MAG: hypothetical protein SLAVMIC_00536 [uncultured marine phage]
MAKKMEYSNYNSNPKPKTFLVLADTETGDLYNISVKNGELICEAKEESVRRENRLKKLLNE